MIEQEIQAAFGTRVRKLRLKLGLSQEQFAARAQLDRSYLGSIERGERNVTLTKVYQIADALEVRPGDLLPPKLGGTT